MLSNVNQNHKHHFSISIGVIMILVTVNINYAFNVQNVHVKRKWFNAFKLEKALDDPGLEPGSYYSPDHGQLAQSYALPMS